MFAPASTLHRAAVLAGLAWAAFVIAFYYRRLPGLVSGALGPVDWTGLRSAILPPLLVLLAVVLAGALVTALQRARAPGAGRRLALPLPWLMAVAVGGVAVAALFGWRRAALPWLDEAGSRTACAVAGAALVATAAWFLGRAAQLLVEGRWLHRAALGPVAARTSRVEDALFRLALGFGVVAYLSLFLAFAGVYTPRVVAPLLAAVVLAGGVASWRARPLINPGLNFSAAAPRGVERAWAALAAFAVALALVGALAPEVEYDAAWYHLWLPRLWLQAGGPVDVVNEYISLYPLTWELIFGDGLALGGAVGAKLLHFACLPLAAAAAWQLTRRFFPPVSPWLAALLAVTVPMVSWEGTTAYVDLALAFYVTLGLYALLRYLDGDGARWRLLAALTLGLGVATKHLGLVVLAIVGAGLAMSAWNASRKARATPAAGTTGATPVAGTTGATPVAGTSGATPAAGTTGATPVARTTGATPVAGTTGATPVAGTSGTTPVAGTTGATPVAATTGATPVARTTGATPAAGTTGATADAERATRVTERIGAAVLLACVAFLLGLPWYGRAWNASGNPVFPEMFGVFGALPPERWDAVTERSLAAFKAHFGFPRTPLNLALLPWNLTQHGAAFAGTIGPLFLAALPWLLAARGGLPTSQPRSEPVMRQGSSRAAAWLSWTVGGYLAVWASPISSFQLRFLVPIMPLAAVLAAVAFTNLFATLRGRLRRAAHLAVAALALLNLPPFLPLHEGDRAGWTGWLAHVTREVPLAVVVGRTSEDAYLRQRVTTYAAWKHLEKTAPPSAVVLRVGGGDNFYATRSHVPGDATMARGAWASGPTGRTTLLETLARLRVSHVMMERAWVQRMAREGAVLASEAFRRERLRLEFEDDRVVLYRVVAGLESRSTRIFLPSWRSASIGW